jgi:broad specificity phosphatase PhoE
MLAAMDEAYESVDSGEVVMVSHQLPIWTVHRQVAGVGLAHSPRNRRCSLCSVTTFHRIGSQWSEVAYVEPATELLHGAVDLGAV